jgi:poly(hydroxyalkanoate) depolymerase family esterase
MKMISPDMLRQAMKGLHTGSLTDANALVQKTLAAHGLANTGLPGTPAPPRSFAKARAPGGSRHSFACAAGTRDYVLHRSDSLKSPRGMVLMLHGCTQTPEDFAIGTGMNAQADAAGFILAYPAQARGDNAQSCWNWFSGADQQRGRGEPAILAGLTQEIAGKHDVPPGAGFAAGLSAGAAMAVILGQTYGDVFAGIGAHSGLPFAAARGMPDAFAAMAGQGKPRRSTVIRPVPTIVFHGVQDVTVNPANAAQIIDDQLGAAKGPQIQTVERGRTQGRSFQRTISTTAEGAALTEDWRIDGLGHAWSGGNPQGSHADAQGPDASAQMIRFFNALAS